MLDLKFYQVNVTWFIFRFSRAANAVCNSILLLIGREPSSAIKCIAVCPQQGHGPSDKMRTLNKSMVLYAILCAANAWDNKGQKYS